jgi:hypothetical protein
MPHIRRRITKTYSFSRVPVTHGESLPTACSQGSFLTSTAAVHYRKLARLRPHRTSEGCPRVQYNMASRPFVLALLLGVALCASPVAGEHGGGGLSEGGVGNGKTVRAQRPIAILWEAAHCLDSHRLQIAAARRMRSPPHTPRRPSVSPAAAPAEHLPSSRVAGHCA